MYKELQALEEEDCPRCVVCGKILTGEEEQKGLCEEHKYDNDEVKN